MEPVAYRTDHSLRLFNIAEAGGLKTGIQDASVPRDQLERLTDTKTFGAAYVLCWHISLSVGGLSDWQGGLVNFNWAIGPKQHGSPQQPNTAAWMPTSEAASPTDAQAKFISHVKISV